MFNLPEQIDASQLRSLLVKQASEVLRVEIPNYPQKILQVEGGSYEEAAGVCRIRITRGYGPLFGIKKSQDAWICSLQLKLPPGSYCIQMSGSIVWTINGQIQSDLSVRKEHKITTSVADPTLIVESVREDLYIGDIVPDGVARGPKMYEIPPAATEIRGHGVVRYMDGETVDISGTVTLHRLGPDGTRGTWPGGVYAWFYGTEPASVRIGNTWIETPRLR
ncbi:MAG: hypothetical protein D6800_03130 [Candidatus Zixiibacteriota bacterium]|nr:MAG: hypothetical protein D6800_03130 [candidate division Zixibacteria bacterium]